MKRSLLVLGWLGFPLGVLGAAWAGQLLAAWEPCLLCRLQRAVWWGGVGLSGLYLLSGGKREPFAGGLFLASFGACLALYHVGLETAILRPLAVCGSPSEPMDFATLLDRPVVDCATPTYFLGLPLSQWNVWLCLLYGGLSFEVWRQKGAKSG